MSFKSYTRKSSANVGADRAGISRDNVIELDGKWGFYEGAVNEFDGVAERFEAETPVFHPIAKHVDRRKAKRALYRELATLRQISKVHNVRTALTKMVRKDLSRCYSRKFASLITN